MLKYMRMNKKLKETTLRFIELNGFEELTNVQEEVLKYAGSGKDVIALSKTGTGKTHAYLIPIMEMINPVSDKTQVVISLPTGELAYQVHQNCLVMKEVFPDLRIHRQEKGDRQNGKGTAYRHRHPGQNQRPICVQRPAG